ncbi:MAG: hypothetical protein HYY16_10030 [Planctomycetes bacterium]|nr:hypothetical protein [Planctomycetota bacterium]
MDFREKLKDVLDEGYHVMVAAKDWDEALDDLSDKIEFLMTEVMAEEMQEMILNLKKVINSADEDLRKEVRRLRERHNP